MSKPEMPYTILTLAPFNMVPEGPYKPHLTSLEEGDLDKALENLGVSAFIPVPKKLCSEGSISLQFTKMKDFHPDGVIKNCDFLANLAEAKDYVNEAVKKGLSNEEIYRRLKDWPKLPLQINYAPKSHPTQEASDVDDILNMVSGPSQDSGSSDEAKSWAAQIDGIIEQLIDYVLKDANFRLYESAWRGVELLVKQGQLNKNVKISLAPISMEQLDKGLEALTTEMVKIQPSVILLDLPFDSSPRSFELLEQVAGLAERMLIPTIAWIDKSFLRISSWNELNKLPFIPNYLEEQSYAKYGRIKKSSEGAWLTLTCNRFLTRYPYGPENKTRLVSIVEDELPWVSPVWALGCLLLQRIAQNGWPTRFNEFQTTKLENLGLYTSDRNVQLATETGMPEDRISQFGQAGIISLVGPLRDDKAFVTRDTTVAGVPLSYQLLVSRVIGFLLSMRDSLGDQLSPGAIESQVKEAFEEFWKGSGHELPEDLLIKVTEAQIDQPQMLSFKMTPPAKVYPDMQPLEFGFGW